MRDSAGGSASSSRQVRAWWGAILGVTLLTVVALPARAGVATHEIVVIVDPAAAQAVGTTAKGLVPTLLGRHGLGEPVAVDKAGALHFTVPDGLDAAQARELARKVATAPGVLWAGVAAGPEARRKLQRLKAFDPAMAEATVLGVIVKFRDPAYAARAQRGESLPPAELARLEAIVGLPLAGSRAMSGGAFVVDFAAPITGLAAAALVQRLESDPAIEHASPNEVVQPVLTPNDSFYDKQWSLTDPVGGIDAPRAWDITTGATGTVVAVIDTGMLYAHPEFKNRTVPGYDFITDPARARDGDGRDPDPWDEGNYAAAGECGSGTNARDSSWHGTHVAGTIAATGNNGAGIAGVDWKAKILPVRVLGRCGGTTADIVDGMRWAAGFPVPGVPDNPNPARIVNMSLGGATPCEKNVAEQTAVIEMLVKGVVIVVSAGNEAANAENYSPAGCYGVLTVGATGKNADRAPYSNFSTLAVDISAPGGNQKDFGTEGGILSTVGTGKAADPGQPAYWYLQGTSMAAPHVSGVAALMLGANPELTIAQILDIFRYTTKPFPAGSSCATKGDCGSGILNAYNAVKAAQNLVGTRWNYTDHWFNPPESGWGVQVTAEGEIQFVTWYTYGPDGAPLWATMVLTRVAQDIFAGDIYLTTGTPLGQINGKPAMKTEDVIGRAVLLYFTYKDAWLYYKVGEVEGTKPLTRLFYAEPATLCRYTTASRATAVNYQDMWWNPAESGWGINLTHQGDRIFATWFSYGDDGTPRWLFMIADRTAAGVYGGEIYMTAGVPWDKIDGTEALKGEAKIGTGTLTFSSGERGRFDYRITASPGNVISVATGSKPIERQVFASPVTLCAPVP